ISLEQRTSSPAAPPPSFSERRYKRSHPMVSTTFLKKCHLSSPTSPKRRFARQNRAKVNGKAARHQQKPLSRRYPPLLGLKAFPKAGVETCWY
ncbi:hypothetical protein, partial [Rhizobium sp. LC145]|uniref:hypothetical protein n=1 Tax=Rhizobium sp. LC145 TaxID=1120688 RepID=UPI001AEC55F4